MTQVPLRRPFPSAGFRHADPFLLLDEMGPVEYGPVEYGPGEAIAEPDHDHPHHGFETVNYVLDGEMEHEASVGHRGRLGAGDVQWMTARRGIATGARQVVRYSVTSRPASKEG
jgi:quercetin 2,3-dioxygenase